MTLTEDQWLKITQSFSKNSEEKPVVEIQPCSTIPRQFNHVSSNFSEFSKASSEEVVGDKSEDSHIPIPDTDVKMNAFLKQKLRAKFKDSNTRQKPIKMTPNVNVSSVEVEPLQQQLDPRVMETIEFKLKSFTLELMDKNHRIEEQEMKIKELEQKLAHTEIAQNFSEGETFHRVKVGESLNEFSLEGIIEQRLIRLETQIEILLKQQQRTNEIMDATTKFHSVKTNNLSTIKPRNNLASIYRQNAHLPENINKEIFEEKISNIEKIVENLKVFLFKLILKNGYK